MIDTENELENDTELRCVEKFRDVQFYHKSRAYEVVLQSKSYTVPRPTQSLAYCSVPNKG